MKSAIEDKTSIFQDLVSLQEVVKMETDLRNTFYGQMFRQLIGTEDGSNKITCQFCYRTNEGWVDQHTKESIIKKIT